MNKYYALIIIMIALLSIYSLLCPNCNDENNDDKNKNINKILINYQ